MSFMCDGIAIVLDTISYELCIAYDENVMDNLGVMLLYCEGRIDNVDQLSEMINNIYVKWKFEIVCEMGGQFLELYFGLIKERDKSIKLPTCCGLLSNEIYSIMEIRDI